MKTKMKHESHTLKDVLGEARFDELVQEAYQSVLYGVPITAMDGDDMLATIGYLCLRMKDATVHLMTINERLRQHLT